MQPNLNEAAALALRRRRGLNQPRQAVRQAPEGRCGTRLARAGASDEGGLPGQAAEKVCHPHFRNDLARSTVCCGYDENHRFQWGGKAHADNRHENQCHKIIWADLFNQAWLLRISGLFQSRPFFIAIFKRPRPVHGQLYARSQSDNCLAAAGKRCRKWCVSCVHCPCAW